MKRRSLLVSLVVAVLWVGSLAVVGYVVTPEPRMDVNPQTKSYNSSKSNTTSIYIGVDERDDIWIGIARIDEDGKYWIGAHGDDSVTVGFDEYGNVRVSEPSRSPEFDDKILEVVDEAFGLWETVSSHDTAMAAIRNIRSALGDEAIAINEEGPSKEPSTPESPKPSR